MDPGATGGLSDASSGFEKFDSECSDLVIVEIETNKE